MMFAGIHAPVGRGELRLTSADPAVQPALAYRYLEDERDRRRLREAVRMSLRLVEHEAFAGMIEERLAPLDVHVASDAALDEWIQLAATTGQHVAGTCRMGPAHDPQAVVDQRGRVHGVQNLWVADASIMPTITRANTNATSIMIGEKVADRFE